MPTFNIPATSVDSAGIVTLTCQDVGADIYTWTFPLTTRTTGSTTYDVKLPDGLSLININATELSLRFDRIGLYI